MSAVNEASFDECKKHECGHCGSSASKICKGCLNMRYCSEEHQVADWHIHKLLCRSFARFQERPEEGLCRAISFPANSRRPYFVWIPTIVEAFSIDHDAFNGSFLSAEDARDEASPIDEQYQCHADEIGWEDARADPTGYEIPDRNSFGDESSNASFSTAARLLDGEEHPGEGVKLLFRRSSGYSEGAQVNKCIEYLVNDRAGASVQGSWELYGVCKATGCGVDLDTTFLTLALLLISEQVSREDIFGVLEDAVTPDAANLLENLEGSAVDEQVVGSAASLAARTLPSEATNDVGRL